MPEHQLLLDLLILLAMALLSALVFTRLRLSPIIGYLVSGVIAGPYGLHLITNLEEVETIAEFGVILLLFTIGLEFSVSRLLRLKRLLLRGGLALLGGPVVHHPRPHHPRAVSIARGASGGRGSAGGRSRL